MNVELTWTEFRQLTEVGCMRRLRAIAYGRVHRYGRKQGDYWGVEIAAAGAEMATAKALGIYWADANEPDSDGDVGAFHVRWTEHENGRLLLHRTDPDDAVFFLVRGLPPNYEIAGWLFAREGKQDRYWQTHTGRPCFMVPQPDLRRADAIAGLIENVLRSELWPDDLGREADSYLPQRTEATV